jgi:hypothetical protein
MARPTRGRAAGAGPSGPALPAGPWARSTGVRAAGAGSEGRATADRAATGSSAPITFDPAIDVRVEFGADGFPRGLAPVRASYPREAGR